MRGDLREGFAAVGFVSRDREARRWWCVGGAAIEDGGERLGVGEGVVNAGPIAMLEVVGAAVEDVVVGAGGHQFEIAVSDLKELWFVLGEEDVGGMAAVAGAASPPAPLVVAGAPGVVPGAVGEHELHVGAESNDRLVEDWLVVGEQSVLGQGWERFFYVVAKVDGAAFLCGNSGLRVAFTEEDAVRGEVLEALVGQRVGALRVVMVAENLGAEGKAVRGGDGVVDVAGVDGDEGVEKFCGAGEAIGPAPARGGV